MTDDLQINNERANNQHLQEYFLSSEEELLGLGVSVGLSVPGKF